MVLPAPTDMAIKVSQSRFYAGPRAFGYVNKNTSILMGNHLFSNAYALFPESKWPGIWNGFRSGLGLSASPNIGFPSNALEGGAEPRQKWDGDSLGGETGGRPAIPKVETRDVKMGDDPHYFFPRRRPRRHGTRPNRTRPPGLGRSRATAGTSRGRTTRPPPPGTSRRSGGCLLPGAFPRSSPGPACG